MHRCLWEEEFRAQLWNEFTCDVSLLRMPLAPSSRYGVMLCTIITRLFTEVYYQSHSHTYCSHFQNFHFLRICLVLRGPGSASALRLLPSYRLAFQGIRDAIPKNAFLRILQNSIFNTHTTPTPPHPQSNRRFMAHMFGKTETNLWS